MAHGGTIDRRDRRAAVDGQAAQPETGRALVMGRFLLGNFERPHCRTTIAARKRAPARPRGKPNAADYCLVL